MAARKTATNKEKEIIAHLALAFVLEEMTEEVFSDHEASFRKYLKDKYRRSYRLHDELKEAIPRVYKQLKKDFEEFQESKEKGR